MKQFDRVIAISQFFILVAWEALGILAFNWSGFYIAAVWFLSLWTFNVLVATATSTYMKLTTPAAKVVNLHAVADAPTITPEDVA